MSDTGCDSGLALDVLKRRDNAIHQLRELMERWDNRLTLEIESLAKRYEQGRLEILLALEFGRNGKTGDALAILQRTHHEAGDNEHGLAGSRIDGKVRHSRQVDNGHQGPVLVGDIHVMDGVERCIPAVVRLERADYINDLWGGAVYVSLLDYSLKVRRPHLGKREINVLDVPIVAPHHLDGGEVKGGAEIVNCVTQNSRELRRNFFPDSYNTDPIARLGIWFYDDRVGVSCEECGDFTIKLRDVMLGPINL